MNILTKKLKILKRINLYGFKYVSLLIENLKNGGKVIDSEVFDWSMSYNLKNYPEFKLDFTDIKLWSTYDDCASFEVEFKNGKVIVVAHIDNEKKFCVTIQVTNKFLTKIADQINWDFEDYLEKLHENYLEEQKKIWMKKTSDKLLGKKTEEKW